MTNARQLLVEYELGVVKDAQLIEWACEILSEDNALAQDQDLISLASLLPSVRAELEMAGEYFRRLIQRHFREFRLRSSEGVQLAREILKRRCEEYVDGRIAPYDLCALVSPIEQHFDFPVWLGDLYNACDWVERSTKRDEVPYLVEEAQNPWSQLTSGWSGPLKGAPAEPQALGSHPDEDTTMAFQLREAREADIPSLAKLHVVTFNETHRGGRPGGPSYELRERQWREAFERQDGSWFCYVIEDSSGELVGFAKGTRHDGGVPGYAGELNKIYLLQRVQRQGLGRRLLGAVAVQFMERGVTSMLLFGDAANPSNGFYEAFGADRLYSETGEFHGAYGWPDLRTLVAQCSG